MNRETMKACPKCHNINRDDARFCHECGFTFSAQNQPHRLCPAGKHPMDLAWTSCPYCSGFQPDVDPSAQTAPAPMEQQSDRADPTQNPSFRRGIVVGNWIIEGKIGEGGMGQVCLARHNTLGSYAAIKALFHFLANDPKFRDRFFQEAQSQSSLKHPHIAQVLDYIEQDGHYFLVVEHLDGGTLAETLALAKGPIEIHKALQLSKQALSALDYAHQRRIIHRDVKPSNIMLDHEGNAHVTDFGIALVMGGLRMTSNGLAIGTAEYMSPEQITRPKDLDHRADVYSMGIVLYEMLTRRVPFVRESEFSVKAAQVNEPPPPPRTINPNIPEALEWIVMRAIAKDPNHRYSGCGEFGRAIEHFERTGQTQPEPHPFPQPPSQPARHTFPQPYPHSGAKPTQGPGRRNYLIPALIAGAIATAIIAGAGALLFLMISPSKLERYYMMRERLETNRKWSEAESEYRKKIVKSPDDTLLYGMLIEALMQQEKYAEAEKIARDAIRIEPAEALWQDLLGDALRSQNKKREAQDAYQKGVHLEKDPAEQRVYSGDFFSAQENWTAAENDYRESLRLKPDRPLLKIVLANFLEKQKNWTEAESLIREALQQAPNKAEYHASLGKNMSDQEKWEEAERAFRNAIRLNSSAGGYRIGLGLALDEQNKVDEAQKEYSAAVMLEPNNASIHNSLGAAFARKKRWKEAEAEYKKAADLNNRS
ncbi:MAG TPA: protein kinase, partial [Blastocatellia bacterium]